MAAPVEADAIVNIGSNHSSRNASRQASRQASPARVATPTPNRWEGLADLSNIEQMGELFPGLGAQDAAAFDRIMSHPEGKVHLLHMFQLSSTRRDPSVEINKQGLNLLADALDNMARDPIIDRKQLESSIISKMITNDETTVLSVKPPTKYASTCLLYTSPSPRDKRQSRMPSSA